MPRGTNDPLMLFCVGAQKAGTTWVHRMLSGHPQNAFPPVKETHIFSGRFVPSLRPLLDMTIGEVRRIAKGLGTGSPAGASTHRWLAQYVRAADGDDDAYRSLFRLGGARVSGDFTPAYALLPIEGFQHIHHLFPDARILFLMRDPADRIWSQVSMDHARRPAALLPDGLNPAQREARLTAYATGEARLIRSRYELTLDRLDATFPSEAIMTAFFEDVFEGPSAQQRFLEALCRHIGLESEPSQFANAGQRIHSSPKLDLPRSLESHLREITAPTVSTVRDRIGRVPDRWLDVL